jgi:hypothetical protein
MLSTTNTTLPPNNHTSSKCKNNVWVDHIRGRAMREILGRDFETVLEVAGVRGV